MSPYFFIFAFRKCAESHLARDYFFKALNIGHQLETNALLLSRIGDTYHLESNEREAEGFYRMAVEHYPESEGAAIAELPQLSVD